MEMIYSYVTRGLVEYEPPVDYDAYDEHENDMYFIGNGEENRKGN